jgi:hypothetical protein
MRRFTTFPVGPDLLTLAAVLALATVVYLCSLPSTFQSLSNRQAGAAELMGQVREHIVKEGQLFSSLVRAGDDQASKLRQQLIDNERGFHEAASEFANELPEDKAEIESLVSRFDHLAATGWQAAATSSQTPPEARQDLLDGAFSQTLEDLRDESQKIELGLHAQDAQ